MTNIKEYYQKKHDWDWDEIGKILVGYSSEYLEIYKDKIKDCCIYESFRKNIFGEDIK